MRLIPLLYGVGSLFFLAGSVLMLLRGGGQ